MPLEILTILKQPPEVFHKKFFSNILRHSQENTCVGVSFLIKLQAIRPVTLLKLRLKRGSNTDISCDYQEIYNNTLKSICERLHRKVFCKNIFQIRTQQRELSMKKMVTCSVKDCSNQSRLNKNFSYHKVLGEERKDLILI